MMIKVSTDMPSPCAVPDAGLFDPSNAATSWTLPANWYTQPEYFALEREQVFEKSWIYVGHVSDLPNSGDFLTATVAGQSIVVTRARDNVLRAFYNVCSHRAHPLVEGTGNIKLIVCPYHQWCYEPDGKFRGAKGRAEIANWIPDNADLKPVQLEDYGGFLFVNLNPDAASLVSQASVLLSAMKDVCPKLDNLSRAHRSHREVAANWKTIVDNNHECYHCSVSHPALMKLMDYTARADWSDDGITFLHKIKGYEAGGAPYTCQYPGEDSLFSFIFPSVIPLFFPGIGGMVMFAVEPTGPETCRITHDFYFPDDATDQTKAEFITYITETLAPEDIALCEQVQQGLRSNGYQQGKFVVDLQNPGYSEHHVHFFQSMVHKALIT